MARTPRKELIDETEVGVYHCINRCVRRAFLCGDDPLTGRCFDHRKEWIRQRLEFLAGQFAVDVLGYAVMSNHLHVILRNRPDIVSEWSDDEVARRWWALFPGRKDAAGDPEEPRQHELDMIMSDRKKLAEIRRRLSSLSWFMRCLAEGIARDANKEDNCKGRFWEGRFKCQPLLDEAALLACSVYVDLNPIRAGMAKTPERSEFTSVHDRIHAEVPRDDGKQTKAREQKKRGRGRKKPTGKRGKSQRRRDGWLSPVELAKEVLHQQRTKPNQRASNRGFLPVSESEYLRLVDWTGRQIRNQWLADRSVKSANRRGTSEEQSGTITLSVRRDKRGAIPADLKPILERLRIVDERWLDTVKHFGRYFRRAVGSVSSLTNEAAKRNGSWLQGITHSREMFI